MPTVTIKPRRARPFFGRHPWVFEGAVARVDGGPIPGQQVRVVSDKNEFIAWGLFNPNSNIRVRLYSWDEERPVDEALIAERITAAVRFRTDTLGLGGSRVGCRLVFSESDGLSGLVVDRYADHVVVQFTALALAQRRQVVVRTLQELLTPSGIYCRTEKGIAEQEGLDVADGLLEGDEPSGPVEIEENGLRLFVDVRTGQKTGAFLDQRDNRLAVTRYTQGQDVLDLFCHAGGFGLLAATKGGASRVTGVDSSAAAIELARRNAVANGVDVEWVQQQAVPAMKSLLEDGRSFGVVVCDPPKFARSAGAVDRALQGYQQINTLALQLLQPGGVLVSCSCSSHVTPELFLGMLASCGQRLGRDVRLLETRGAAPDHPVSLFCPETSYLKCAIAHCP